MVRSEEAEYQRTTMPVVTGPRGQICTTYIQQSTVEGDEKGNYWLIRIF